MILSNISKMKVKIEKIIEEDELIGFKLYVIERYPLFFNLKLK